MNGLLEALLPSELTLLGAATTYYFISSSGPDRPS